MGSSERVSPHRLPIVWLAAAILAAILAACIITIVLAGRYPDEPSSVGPDSLLNMPLSRVR